MKIYSFIDEFSSLLPCILTIGVFDGVHMGHQKIIQNLILSAEKKYCPVFIIFYSQPKEILNPGNRFFYLNTLSERIYNMKKIGIEHLIVHHFTIIFSKLSTNNFFNNILILNKTNYRWI